MSARTPIPLLLAASLAVAAVTDAEARRDRVRSELSTEVSLESRWFWDEAQFAEQSDADAALIVQPEWYWEWKRRRAAVTFKPYLRLDSNDSQRSAFDLREAYVRFGSRHTETRVGLRRVFWGATESVHLVDIINQTDTVSNPDGEDKLGQPMINVAWIGDYGTLDAFLMPVFRERPFAGPEGRLRAGLPIDESAARYESSREHLHPDYALRWFKTLGPADVGIGWFDGTSRAPRFEVELRPGGPVLIPVYEQIRQASLDVTAAVGGLLLKAEGYHRRSERGDYVAAAGGFEYTFVGVFGSAVDVGLLGEYLWDERDDPAASPFEDDVFAGIRIAGNDIASTQLLAGAIMDNDSDAVFGTVEASRRFGNHWKAVLELRVFDSTEPGSQLNGAETDDYLSLEIVRFF